MAIWPERTRVTKSAVAAMLLAELAAECKAAGITLRENLDRLFIEYGCHLERTISHTMPGAEGLAQMQLVMDRLRTNPPSKLGGLMVQQVRDYLRRRHKDTLQRFADLRSVAAGKSRRSTPLGHRAEVEILSVCSGASRTGCRITGQQNPP